MLASVTRPGSDTDVESQPNCDSTGVVTHRAVTTPVALAKFGDATRLDLASSEMAMMAGDHRQMWRFRRRAQASSFSAMVDRVEASIDASDDAAALSDMTMTAAD
jgi:hypothetical protein